MVDASKSILILCLAGILMLSYLLVLHYIDTPSLCNIKLTGDNTQTANTIAKEIGIKKA